MPHRFPGRDRPCTWWYLRSREWGWVPVPAEAKRPQRARSGGTFPDFTGLVATTIEALVADGLQEGGLSRHCSPPCVGEREILVVGGMSASGCCDSRPSFSINAKSRSVASSVGLSALPALRTSSACSYEGPSRTRNCRRLSSGLSLSKATSAFRTPAQEAALNSAGAVSAKIDRHAYYVLTASELRR
jgi:hypothetical protein